MAKDDKEDVAHDEDEKAESSADASQSNGEKKEPAKAAADDAPADEKKAAEEKAEKPAKKVEAAEKPAEKKASEPKKSDAKGGDKKGDAKKGDAKAAEKKAVPKGEVKAARDHSASEAAAAAHGNHAPDRKQYWVIFVVLFVLTVLEVAIAQIPGIAHTLMAVGLISLALTKAACVGLYYMHLKGEAKVLRMSVAIPFSAPIVYALVLISEAAWRLTR